MSLLDTVDFGRAARNRAGSVAFVLRRHHGMRIIERGSHVTGIF
jgi:hypothetical protein